MRFAPGDKGTLPGTKGGQGAHCKFSTQTEKRASSARRITVYNRSSRERRIQRGGSRASTSDTAGRSARLAAADLGLVLPAGEPSDPCRRSNSPRGIPRAMARRNPLLSLIGLLTLV